MAAMMLGAITPVEIMRELDKNEVWDSISYDSEMIIHISGKKYVKTMLAWATGDQNFFIEFTNDSDAGTRYLKKDGNLYVYSEDTEETIPITGHLLKESMMGSDFSYEDMTNNEALEDIYTGRIIEETTLDGQDVWVLELKARKKGVAYAKKVIWVRKSDYTGIKQEWYSLSGFKLKLMKVNKIEKINGKDFPTEIEVQDLLREDSKTIVIMKNIKMDVTIPASKFSIRNLER